MSEPDKIPELELDRLEGDESIPLIQRIDALADFLINFAKTDGATPAIKVKIFGEAVAWSKVKKILDPQGMEGNRLKEFGDELKSRKGNGPAGKRTGARKPETAAVGADIRKLIRSLPTPAHPGGDRGGTQNLERSGLGGARIGGIGWNDVPGDGNGDGNGSGNGRVV